MATIVAQATGNWSAGATWTGGTKPGSGDTAQTGAYTVTIDEDVTCAEIQATSSGRYIIAAARTINANIYQNSSYNPAVSLTHTTGTVTINGNLSRAFAAGGYCVTNTSTGNVTVVGTLTGESLRNNSTGTVNVTGNISGSNSGNYALYNVSTGAVNVTGDIAGGSATSTEGLRNQSTGIVTVTGNITGGSVDPCYGANNIAGGTINASGTATGGSANNTFGLHNNGTGTVTCDQAVGGTHAGAPGLVGSNSGGTTTYKRIGSQANGNAALRGFCKMVLDADYNVITVKDSSGNDVSMSNDYPAVTDVKTGVVYNRTTLTGTYAGASGGMLAANKRGGKQ